MGGKTMNNESVNATETRAVPSGTELKTENVGMKGKRLRPCGLSKMEKTMLADVFYFPSKEERIEKDRQARKEARDRRKGLGPRPKGLTRVQRKQVQAMQISGETPQLEVKDKPKKSRRVRKVGMTVEDFAISHIQNPFITVKGRLPSQRYDDMRVYVDGKVHYNVPDALPPEVKFKYRRLLHDRYIRRKRHQNWKMCEGTLRAFDNKYL